MTAKGAGASGLRDRWNGLGLTAQILIGLGIGILIGLFLGDRAAALQGFASAFIGIMQMTVLPYLVVALILGLGRLTPAQARLLAGYGALTLLAIWAIALLVIAVMPLSFPKYQSAFFFSTTLLQPREPIAFFDLYIPANPFFSMANSLVPAVTLFSAAVGIALIGTEGKERLLGPLDAMMQALARVTQFVVQLTPLGVIPIAAVAAGTLSLEDLSRLQVYFLSFIVAAIVLGAILLPLLVSSITPFRYRELLAASSDALLTAFVTSSAFIVLPMLAAKCEQLAASHGIEVEHRRGVADTLIPIAFNFPTAGKLLTLLFVPFAAWLAGGPLDLAAYPVFLLSGIFSYFAKAQVALPFLMDLVEVPHDLFQLYIPSTLLNGKFDSAVGAMSLFTFTMIMIAAVSGRLRMRVAAILRFGIVAASVTAIAVLATRAGLEAVVDTTYDKADVLKAMHLSRTPPPTAVYRQSPPPDAYANLTLTPLQRVRARRSLRVGYQVDRLPFTFFNSSDRLVGFDVEMASQLARDLGVRLEFVPVTLATFEAQLTTGEVDVVPSIPYTHYWIDRLRMSRPYIEGTLGLLVKDERRHEFESAEDLRAHGMLTIGVPGQTDLYEDYAREFLAGTRYRLVEISSWSEFYAGAYGPVDAVVMLAEVGMAWSLVHPEYAVVIPRKPLIRRPLGYAFAQQTDDLARYVDQWLVLQQARGNVDRAYGYWILGQGSNAKAPRWSIGHDVLGLF